MQFMQFNKETSFYNALTVNSVVCKYISRPRNQLKHPFVMKTWCIVILYRLGATQHLDTR